MSSAFLINLLIIVILFWFVRMLLLNITGNGFASSLGTIIILLILLSLSVTNHWFNFGYWISYTTREYWMFLINFAIYLVFGVLTIGSVLSLIDQVCVIVGWRD